MGSMLNLERVPNLAPKFANKLGKSATEFSVVFSMTGMTVMVKSRLDSEGDEIEDGATHDVALLEFERRVALSNAPSNEERLSALQRKYELRLNKPFPEGNKPRSGSESAIQAWLGSLPFAERVALLKSQKDFNKSYPNGFRVQSENQ